METPVSATARAELSNASSSTVSGHVVFTEVGQDSVELQLSITGAEPGEHALHLHENGDCSAEDASSAGGHWNPTNNQHGQRGSGEFHKGDVMNLTVEENGNAEVSMVVTGWTIGGNQQSNILNKAVIIHAGADDFTSQPSGDAGKRIACGVIVED
jgi:Cu-Zn family superoxide dismutase